MTDINAKLLAACKEAVYALEMRYDGADDSPTQWMGSLLEQCEDAVYEAEQAASLTGCGICGSHLVEIRPQYPHGQRREVCPTCLADRMDLIRQYADPNYGKAYRSELITE